MTDPAKEAARITETESVSLSFPASVDLVVLARFTAATVAARAGFDVDEIEDLRLAVDELCVSFGPIESHSDVHLRFTRDEDNVRIDCEFDPLGNPALDGSTPAPTGLSTQRADELSRQLLEALVDDHGRDETGRRPCAWLEKRRTSGNP